jgi:hypothetical protein
MVAGEICEPPLPPALLLEPVEAEAVAKESNRLVLAVPVAFADDDFEEVSAWRASIADDAAPRANNMTEPQQRRELRLLVHACCSASAMPAQKTQ